MTSGHRETEDKYDVDGSATMPDLRALDGVHTVDGAVTHHLEARYFDTADLTLLRARVTLRRRTGGDDDGWHLKLPLEDARHEVRVPLGRAVQSVPKALRTVVVGLVRDGALTPVASLHTDRTTRVLRDGSGVALAEVADDVVSAELSATGESPAESLEWREWEVELVDGDAGLLDVAVTALEAAGARPSRHPSKLGRALAGRLPEGPTEPVAPRVRPKGAAGDVVLARLVDLVGAVHRLDPLVRSDAPDSVHQMRVALRRLRSALRTFGPLLDGPGPVRLREELKWLGVVLGAARDAEVMRERLLAQVDREPEQLVRGGARRRIDLDLGRDHRDAWRESVAAMSSDRYWALLDGLDALVADPPWSPAAGERADAVLPARVRREWKRLRRRERRAREAADPDARDVLLHDVRKAAKRARYAAETLAPAWGKPAERFVRHTKNLQSVLGDHQDTVLTRRRLVTMADEANDDGRDTFCYGLLHAREHATAVTARDGFVRAWRRAEKPKVRRWLG